MVGDSPCFECAAVGGKNKLGAFICAEACVVTRKTNHSLRATGATALFNACVPEKLIRDVTGHRSNALHLYEKPTEQQRKHVSHILMNGSELDKDNSPSCSGTSVSTTSMAVEQSAHFADGIFRSVFSGFNNCDVKSLASKFHCQHLPSSTKCSANSKST